MARTLVEKNLRVQRDGRPVACAQIITEAEHKILLEYMHTFIFVPMYMYIDTFVRKCLTYLDYVANFVY